MLSLLQCMLLMVRQFEKKKKRRVVHEIIMEMPQKLMDFTVEYIFYWKNHLQFICYVTVFVIFLNQTVGINYDDNHNTVIWNEDGLPYMNNYIKVDELVVDSSYVDIDDETWTCLNDSFNNQLIKLTTNVSTTFIIVNENEISSFKCFDSYVPDYSSSVELRSENISIFTWSLHAAPDNFSEDEVIATITHTLLKWSYEIPVDFIYGGRYIDANITISFHTMLNHGILYKNKSINCSSPFRLNDIAHASRIDHPDEQARGQIHFNGFHRTWSM